MRWVSGVKMGRIFADCHAKGNGLRKLGVRCHIDQRKGEGERQSENGLVKR